MFDLLMSNKAPQMMPLFLLMAFFAITFLQSAIDKVMDWKGNLSFLKGHFKNSPLASQVPLMLGTLTAAEFISGLACSYAIARILIKPTIEPVGCALTISGLTLLMLLFGQRLAKDYAGAATVGNYMLMILLGFVLI